MIGMLLLASMAAAAEPVARDYGATAAIGTRIYWVGGTIGATTKIQSFDVATREWTTHPDMPTGRYNAGAASSGDRLWAVGGATIATGVNTAAAEVFDATNGSWSRASAYPEALSGVALEALDGQIYAFGGRWIRWTRDRSDLEVGAVATARVWTGSKWRDLAPMPNERARGEAVALDGRVWLVGSGTIGVVGGLRQVDVYDPAKDAWTSMRSLPEGCDCAAVAWGGTIVALGGREPASTTRPAVWDPEAGAWVQKAARPDAFGDVIDGAEVVDGRIVAITHHVDGRQRHLVVGYDPTSDVWTTLYEQE